MKRALWFEAYSYWSILLVLYRRAKMKQGTTAECWYTSLHFDVHLKSRHLSFHFHWTHHRSLRISHHLEYQKNSLLPRYTRPIIHKSTSIIQIKRFPQKKTLFQSQGIHATCAVAYLISYCLWYAGSAGSHFILFFCNWGTLHNASWTLCMEIPRFRLARSIFADMLPFLACLMKCFGNSRQFRRGSRASLVS